MGMTAGHPPPYNDFASRLREHFGGRVYKIPLSLGLPCPNKDGRISGEGCLFCDEYGAGPLATHSLPLQEQIEFGLRRLAARHGTGKAIAYFQANTSTAAPLPRLREAADLALGFPQIVGVAVGTRPDCLPGEMLDFLGDLNRRTYLWVELGLQTVHAAGLAFLRRHHSLEDFLRACRQLKMRSIRVCAHMILGIPGEGEPEIAASARLLGESGVDGVKLHPLHVLKNTELAKRYAEGKFVPPTLPEYARSAVRFLEHLAPEIVVHRLTGEREKEIFVAPAWAQDKARVLHAVRRLMDASGTWQGRALGAPLPRPAANR